MLQLHSAFGIFLRPCAKAKCKTKNASNLAPNFIAFFGIRVWELWVKDAIAKHKAVWLMKQNAALNPR